MRLAGLAMLGLVALFLYLQPKDMNLVNVVVGGVGLTFLGLGSIRTERRRR
jgi:hypothetical protein